VLSIRCWLVTTVIVHTFTQSIQLIGAWGDPRFNPNRIHLEKYTFRGLHLDSFDCMVAQLVKLYAELYLQSSLIYSRTLFHSSRHVKVEWGAPERKH